jgi:hypothetical protein
VALYTDGAMPLHKVTCVPRGHALGVVSNYGVIVSTMLTSMQYPDFPTSRNRSPLCDIEGVFGNDRRVHGWQGRGMVK